MNAAATKTAVRYAGAWGAIVFAVVLLSLLFTFLGTITCAVLVGMMMGAFKGAKWFSASVSLVFPGVIFGMVRGAKVELTPQQVLLLGVLCFAAFWVTYLVSAFVFFCEQKEKQSSRLPVPAPRQPAPPRGDQAAATGCTAAAKPLGSAKPARESCLEQLQGNWVWEAASASESLCKRVIQIKETTLELKAIDASGRMTLLAAGAVTLQSLKPAHPLVIPQRASEPADFIVGL